MVTKTLLFLILNLQAREPCSKQIAEEKVVETCRKISVLGEAVKIEWPEALLFKNCGDNYAWVHDTSPEVKLVMHPIRQRMVGRDVGKIMDENKKAIFIEFNKAARASKNGAWVNYAWTKPGADHATAKSSFVKECALPNGKKWVVGSGIWLEDTK